MAQENNSNNNNNNNTQQTQIPAPPPQREFIRIETAENSRINKGNDENIYITTYIKERE